MTEVQVDGRHVRGRRSEGELGVEPIARLENELPARTDMSDWLDRVMNAVEAVWIVFAVLTRLRHDQRCWALDIAGIGQRDATAPDKIQGNYWHGPNKFSISLEVSFKVSRRALRTMATMRGNIF